MSKLKMGVIIIVLLAMSGIKRKALKVFTSLLLVRHKYVYYNVIYKLYHLIVSLATSSVFTTHPQDHFIHNNEDAVFECAANGSESLMINWTRNDKPILYSHFYISNGTMRSVLKVSKATVDDSGIYQCIATNADNETILSTPAELLSKTVNRNGNMYLPLYVCIVLPSMKTHPDNITVLTGQSVNLTCSATGTDVVYQWMRNGVIISDDNSNVLRINEIKQSDDGIYQCIASNKGGNAISNPAMIKVYGKRLTTFKLCTS